MAVRRAACGIEPPKTLHEREEAKKARASGDVFIVFGLYITLFFFALC